MILRTYNSWLKVNKYSTRHMFACPSLAEEGVEGVVSPSDGLVTRHLAVRLDAMLEAIQLPACIANLDTSLAHMDGNALTLQEE